jgi:hypothetical protein
MNMNKTIRLGNLAGLKLMAKGNAVVSSLVLWVLLTIVGAVWLDLGMATAVIGALIATILHWLGELWHNLGHAWAARRTGHPMSGVMAMWLIAGSLYPPDEGELPARVHIQRALGGPIGSALLALVMGLVAWAVRPLGGLIWYLAFFFFLDNLLVFTLGAFLPLGFTDGSTLLRYARR